MVTTSLSSKFALFPQRFFLCVTNYFNCKILCKLCKNPYILIIRKKNYMNRSIEFYFGCFQGCMKTSSHVEILHEALCTSLNLNMCLWQSSYIVENIQSKIQSLNKSLTLLAKVVHHYLGMVNFSKILFWEGALRDNSWTHKTCTKSTSFYKWLTLTLVIECSHMKFWTRKIWVIYLIFFHMMSSVNNIVL